MGSRNYRFDIYEECSTCVLCFDMEAAERIIRLCTPAHPFADAEDPDREVLVQQQMTLFFDFLLREGQSSALPFTAHDFWERMLNGLIENLEQSYWRSDKETGRVARMLLEEHQRPAPVLSYLNAVSLRTHGEAFIDERGGGCNGQDP